MADVEIISSSSCPFAQRTRMALMEKGIEFELTEISLDDKPDWFLEISPLGKVPLLKIEYADGREAVLFESAVILEYLEDTLQSPLHPRDALERARHRGWIEFGSAILNGIARFYSAPDQGRLTAEAQTLSAMFARVEGELGEGPWFAGRDFSLVDSVYGPIFRYFDVIENGWFR